MAPCLSPELQGEADKWHRKRHDQRFKRTLRGPSTGVKKTEGILWAFFGMVILFSLAGWVALTISWYAADLAT